MAAAVVPSAAMAGSITVANQPFRAFEVTAPEHTGNSVASRAGLGIDDAITTAPEGKVTMLTRSGKAYYATWNAFYEGEYSSLAAELVECDNGDVYLKNPVSMLTTNLYIKGQRQDKTLVFELPQVAYLEPYYENIYPYKFTNCIYSDSTDTYYPVNSAKAQELNLPSVADTFVVEMLEDGTYRYTAPENGDVIAGLVDIDSDMWVGYGEILSVWQPVDYTLTAIPEGLVTEDIAIYSEEVGHYAKIGFDNDDVYVQGLFTQMPSAWIKGTRKGDSVVFASGQYTGIYGQYNAYTFFVGARYDSEANRLVYADAITFDYNKEGNMLIAKENEAAVLSGEANDVAYIEYLLNPEFHWFPSDMSYDPEAPALVEYDYSPKYHDLCVRFTLPDVNKDGLLLDVNNIYYSFYVDDKLFVFDPVAYPTIKEEMSLIPYSFTDGREIMFLGGIHEAWFYFDEPKPVGIQAFYIKNGETLGKSDITIASDQTSGIEEVVANGSQDVKSIEYYNVSGQKVSKPANGLYIKVTNYTDGTRSTEKSMVK